MPPKAPAFWRKKQHPLGALLSPLGMAYDMGVRLRFRTTVPYRSRLPVICVGNFTLGGTGKTPFAIELCKLLQAEGLRPAFITRGYGGRLIGPHRYDPETDTAREVGDEPLLLGKHAPVMISADRVLGARKLEQMDGDVIIMDDGFQNPALHKDLSLIVVDGLLGVGNERVFPAGPLRAALRFQLARADAVIINGAAPKEEMKLPPAFDGWQGEKLHSRIVADGDTGWLEGARVAAICGIANPLKFYMTLEQYGASIASRHAFPDHYEFSEQDATDILKQLQEADEVIPVMTEKDWVRLPGTGARGQLKQAAKVLRIRLQIDREAELCKLVLQKISQRGQ